MRAEQRVARRGLRGLVGGERVALDVDRLGRVLVHPVGHRGLDELGDEHRDAGDVVVAAARLRELDHLLERLARLVGAHALGDLLLDREVVVEPIAAQQQPIVLLERDVRHLDADVGGHADCIDEDRAQRRDLCLLDRQLALDDEDLGDRVVGRDLRGLAVAHQVRAAVADVGDERLRAGDQHDIERRAHALLVGLGLAALEHGLMGLEHGVLQQLDQAAAAGIRRRALERVDLRLRGLERGAHGLDGHRGCDLAGGVAAHAIGHDEEALGGLHERGVLVVIANDSDVRDEPRFERHAGGLVCSFGRHHLPNDGIFTCALRGRKCLS